MENKIKIQRVWSMPNKWTFKIKPIRELLEEEMGKRYIDGLYNPFPISATSVNQPITKELFDRYSKWADPFAGYNSPAKYTNDLDKNAPTIHHIDALEFLRGFKDNAMNGILFDPPYSITQAKEHYKGYGMDRLNIKPTSMKYWAECKNEMARIIKPGGKAICFGWNSMGLGKNRGFKMTRILLVPHGGSKNDTIVTVEKKL